MENNSLNLNTPTSNSHWKTCAFLSLLAIIIAGISIWIYWNGKQGGMESRTEKEIIIGNLLAPSKTPSTLTKEEKEQSINSLLKPRVSSEDK